MDQRYVGLVGYVNVKLEGIAADTELEIRITAGVTDQVILRDFVRFVSIAGGSGVEGAFVWTPPAVIMPAKRPREADPTQTPPFIRITTTNTLGVDMTTNVKIYLFAADARENTPLPLLLDVLKRG
jgi:hypothetical protein